jgi:hypothetical protein
MRRSIFVSAFVLVLVTVLCGDAFSLNRPYGYTDPRTGDDHTWGGDQSSATDGGNQHGGLNGTFRPVDIVVTHIFFKWLGFDGKGHHDIEAEIIVNHRIDNTTTPQDEPATTNIRGGL